MARSSQARQGVFVSYARKDGEAFANALRLRLEAENIKLWQDRTEIEGGIGWQKQIEEALERVEFFVIVMTPHAMRSTELERKLETKNGLIVIDDVWDAAHLRPFLRGGPECARLITTRMRTVAADAQRVDGDSGWAIRGFGVQ